MLSDFTLQEALPLAEGLSLPTDAATEMVTWVYRWTEGHPYLTQLLCQLLEEQHRTAWLETEVDECIRNFIVSPQGLREPNFQFVRTALTEPDANGISLLEPYLDLLEGKTENLKTNPAEFERLYLVGVLREDDDDEIAIRNLLYQEAFPIEWVKRHLRPPTPSPQSVTPPLPATRHSYVMAASLFLLGVGALIWFFRGPVSQPLSVSSQEVPSVSVEPSPPTALPEIAKTPQQPEALTQAQEKIQDLEATIVRYQQLSGDEVQSLIDQRTQLETQLVSKEDALSNLQDQVQTLEATLVEQRDALKNTIAALQTERTELQTKATATTKELNTAIEEVKTLQMAVLEKSSLSPKEISKLMADRSQLDTQLKTANTELALAHERARELDSLLAQQKQLVQTENQRLTEDRARLETKMKGLEATIADTRKTLSTKEATAREQAELASSELKRIQQERTKYQELLATSQQDLSSLKNQTANLEATLAQKDQAIQEEQRERDRLNTELSQARQELNSAKTQVATLGDQLSTAVAEVAENKNALQAIHASSSEQANRSEEQATELALLRSTLPTQLQESQTALTQAQEQIKQLETNSAKISEIQDTLRKTTEERDQYSQKLQGTEQQLAKAQDNIRNLEQSLRAVSSTAKSSGADGQLSSTPVKSMYPNSSNEADIVKVVSRISAKLTQVPSPIPSKTARLLWARQAYLLNLQTQGTEWNKIDRSLRDGLHTSPIHLKGVSSKIHTLTFDPSGDHVIAGTSDGKIFLWSMSHPLDSPRIFAGHTAGVVSAAVSPNGQQIASGSLDSTIRLWNLSQATTPLAFFRPIKKAPQVWRSAPMGNNLHLAAKTTRFDYGI